MDGCAFIKDLDVAFLLSNFNKIGLFHYDSLQSRRRGIWASRYGTS